MNKDYAERHIIREITPLSDKDCFYIVDRHKKEFTYPIHCHKEFELNFIEHGAGLRRIVGDSVETVAEYDLVLITSADLEHVWEQADCHSEDIREITIQFSPHFFDSLIDTNQFDRVKTMLNHAQNGLCFPLPAIMKIYALLDTLPETKGFYAVTQFLTLLYELSFFIDSAHKLSSAVAFSRFFKLRTGKVLSDYIIDIRLGHASRLLVDSTMSVAEICYECGFNNLSNFNRIFKKKKNCSPKEFRENYCKKKIVI